MKTARKVSNVHAQVHFKQKQRRAIAFTANTLPLTNHSCKGAEYFIVNETACHQHPTVPKMNSPMVLPNK